MKKHEMLDKIIQYQMRQITTAQVSKFLDDYTKALSPPAITTVIDNCRKCNCEIINNVGDNLCAECWSRDG